MEVAAFKELEKAGISAENKNSGQKNENSSGAESSAYRGRGSSLAELVFSTCKRLTAPLRIGLTADLRVCEPRVSEGIAELAREVAGAE